MNILFLFGCIPVRIFLAYLSTIIKPDLLPYFGIILGIMSFGFLWLYFTNGRLSAPEAGGVTWWAHLRLIHGLLYLAASIYSFQKSSLVWIPLTIDVIFGLFAHLFLKPI
jgi:hypothetical protein